MDTRIHHPVQQRSKEWFKLRLGRITSSSVYKLCTNRKEFSTSGVQYLLQLKDEIKTGSPTIRDFGPYAEEAMAFGNQFEDLAMQYLALEYDDIQEGDFVTYGEYTGSSPDGYVGDYVIEIKCPYNAENHIKNFDIKDNASFKKLRRNYYWQMQHQLWVTDKPKGLFVSFDPRLLALEDSKCMHTVEITRDDLDNYFETIIFNKSKIYLQ